MAAQLLEDSLGVILKWFLKGRLERCQDSPDGAFGPPAPPPPRGPVPATPRGFLLQGLS